MTQRNTPGPIIAHSRTVIIGTLMNPAKVPNWLKSLFYFCLVLLVVVLLWEGYKLLGDPTGKYLRGTSQVKVGDERVPGPLCGSLGLCEVEMPGRTDNRPMTDVKHVSMNRCEP